jgi:NADH-quinone oxidoreductase subunit G
MCDEGRMTYKLENDNRLNVAQVTGRDSGFNEAVETVRRAMSQAQKTVMLVSPNASLEQLFTVQQLAVAMNATLTGYSDGYIKKDDGDDFLIKDDKSANRKAFALLGIDSSKAGFDAAINGADLLISFQNDLSRSLNEGEMTKVLETVKLISISSSLDASALKAAVALPIASYSEDTGSILNEDNMLQRYEKAVVKNTPAFDLIHVVHLLGGDIKNCHEARTGLSTTIAALKDVDLEQIPGEGLALTENEVANVAA